MLNRILYRMIVAACCLALPGAALGQTPGNPATPGQTTLQPPVEQWLRGANLPPEALSVFVQRVDAAQPWVSINSQAPQNPASLMKLVTTYAALELLGPAFTWPTTVQTQGTQNGSTLAGDVVIKASGDPALRVQDAWLLLRQLRLQGIRDIRGDLVIDRSAFAVAQTDPGAFDGEGQRCYNAGPDALVIGGKCIVFTFRYDTPGNQWRVSADPRPLGLEVQANITPSAAPCTDWRSGLTMRFEPQARPPKAVFEGSIPTACGAQLELPRTFFSNAQFNASVLRQLWEEQGGRLSGRVREGAAAEPARVLAQVQSVPLAQIVRDINKGSLNLAARALYLQLGLGPVPSGGPPSLEKSRAALDQWLNARGWPMPELVIENGSGLSRTERISAANLGKMLVGAYHSPVMPEFISSLPVAGVDGTMRRRLRGPGAGGMAHIKTGFLRDARGIAGYVLAASGQRYAVVSIINGEALLDSQAIHDQLLLWIQQNG
jgi:serine-type D-Ala-D-Ala carboxypeptidase/endopeptidase (penicillin-binding protein 4)